MFLLQQQFGIFAPPRKLWFFAKMTSNNNIYAGEFVRSLITKNETRAQIFELQL